MKGTIFVRLKDLPKVTAYGDNSDDYCGDIFHAATKGGRLAEQLGWRVVKEMPYDGLTAVLIVRGYDPMTSAHCFSKDANVAIFEGIRLIGVLYSKGKDSEGIIDAENVGDQLRIWDDTSVIGEISAKGNNFTFDNVTESDSACGGKYSIPAIFRLSYSRARKLLIEAGWIPTRSMEQTFGAGDRTSSYHTRYEEVDACSGTGYGYCGFELRAKGGAATIKIITQGEADDPMVVRYGVICAGKQRR